MLKNTPLHSSNFRLRMESFLRQGSVTGFTLIEILVVVIIIGILATLGIVNYQTIVEKARSAEAKSIMGEIRSLAYIHHMKYDSLQNAAHMFSNNEANIGPLDGNIPDGCAQQTHYFRYSAVAQDGNEILITAVRCRVGGKPPLPTGAFADNATITLLSNLSTGIDTWNTGTYK